jgi:hypothetical protein
MRITLSPADLQDHLCPFTEGSGVFTLTVVDPQVRAQILALLLPGSTPPAAPAGCVPWRCGVILEGAHGQHPLLVGLGAQWV